MPCCLNSVTGAGEASRLPGSAQECTDVRRLWDARERRLHHASDDWTTEHGAGRRADKDVAGRLSPRSMPPLPHSRLFAVSPRSSSSPELDSPLEEAVEELISATCNLEDVQACPANVCEGPLKESLHSIGTQAVWSPNPS